MKINFLAGLVGAALILAPAGLAQRQDDGQTRSQSSRNSDDVRQAIAFQRGKDRADARQARLEARHPSVDYSNADRLMDESNTGRPTPDPGERQWKKDKN
jgi:hypothetical protein